MRQRLTEEEREILEAFEAGTLHRAEDADTELGSGLRGTRSTRAVE